MKESLKNLYGQLTIHNDPTINSILNITIIIIVGFLIWWVFNTVVSRFHKKLGNRPFFKENSNFFKIIKKEGHSVIIVMIGIGIINYRQQGETQNFQKLSSEKFLLDVILMRH